MENRKRPTPKEANQYKMVDYLAGLGFYPDRKKSNAINYWYNSPLNPPDSDASFKVNLNKNTWFDFISWKGGTLIDFAIKYHDCTIGEFLNTLAGGISLPQPYRPALLKPELPEVQIEVIKTLSISSNSLIAYLKQRRIDLEVAEQFSLEVHYAIGDKKYFGIGIRNNSGGWAIRNPYFKTACPPVDITTINNGSENVTTIEGSFNYLSFATLYKNTPVMEHDVCLLNGLGLFERARPFLEQHATKNLYLDYGTGGDRVTKNALGLKKNYIDCRALYKGYDDINDWHVNFGKPIREKKGIIL